MSVLTIGPYKAGEIPKPIVFTFQDNGAPINLLTANWTARANLRRYLALANIVSGRACAYTGTGADGQVTFLFQTGDLAVADDYVLEVWIGDATHKMRSQRCEFFVAPSIQPVPTLP